MFSIKVHHKYFEWKIANHEPLPWTKQSYIIHKIEFRDLIVWYVDIKGDIFTDDNLKIIPIVFLVYCTHNLINLDKRVVDPWFSDQLQSMVLYVIFENLILINSLLQSFLTNISICLSVFHYSTNGTIWFKQIACGYLLTLDAPFMKGIRCTFWWS